MTPALIELRDRFAARLGQPFAEELLFDRFDQMTFFIKDEQGRYVAVNRTLVIRCGATDKGQLIGRTAREVYPSKLGEHFHTQDIETIRSGRPLIDELEKHPYPRRTTGWCLTTKLPLESASGLIVGLIGVSKDLHAPKDNDAEFAAIANLIALVKRTLHETHRTRELAERIDLPARQLDQRVRELFGLTTSQLVLQIRLQAAAARLLETDDPVTRVAASVGYADQSAFARRFRKSFGLTPTEYRRVEGCGEGQ